MATGFAGCERALLLLGILQRLQAGLARPGALAFERVAFAEVFDHAEPGHRIRRFLAGD